MTGLRVEISGEGVAGVSLGGEKGGGVDVRMGGVTEVGIPVNNGVEPGAGVAVGVLVIEVVWK